MKSFMLIVSTPQGEMFHEPAVKLSLRGAMGDLAIMAGHTPLVTTVQQGQCRIELESGEEKAGQTEGGILTVGKENVTLLSGCFEWE